MKPKIVRTLCAACAALTLLLGASAAFADDHQPSQHAEAKKKAKKQSNAKHAKKKSEAKQKSAQ